MPATNWRPSDPGDPNPHTKKPSASADGFFMHTASAPSPSKTAIQKTPAALTRTRPHKTRYRQNRQQGGGGSTLKRRRMAGGGSRAQATVPKQLVHCTAVPPHEKEAAPDGAASLTVQSGTVRSVTCQDPSSRSGRASRACGRGRRRRASSDAPFRPSRGCSHGTSRPPRG